MPNPAWFDAVAILTHDKSRGTAFAISNTHALTAHHVLKHLTSPNAPSSSEPAMLTFRDGSREPCQIVAWDDTHDWMLLERLQPTPRPSVPMVRWDLGQPAWRSFGFPDSKPDGMAVGGTVSSWEVAWNGVDVIQLFCNEGAAGNFEVKGLSGAPCVINDSAAVGILRSALFDPHSPKEGLNAAATILACPIQQVLIGLTARGIELPHVFQPARLPRLCERQRRRTLSELIRREHFLPELHTPRVAVESFLAQLISSAALGQPSCTFVALVGGSGVGKTGVLASTAHSVHADAVLLLLRATDVASDSRSLANDIRRELMSSAVEEHAAAEFDVLALWRDQAGPKVVLLDGLNELPTAIDAAAWLERTVSWLEANPGTVLVTTCRPEYWQRCASLVPRRLRVGLPEGQAAPDSDFERPVRPPPDTETGPSIFLGDFDLEEAGDALRRAFGAKPPVATSEAYHPLLLRIYRELDLASARNGQAIGKARALELFVRGKVDLVALRGGAVAPMLLLFALRRLAARIALNNGTGDGPAEDFPVLTALFRTGLLIEVGDEISFVHDEVLEYLASAALNLADFDDSTIQALIDSPEQHKAGALKFALMSALSDGQSHADARRVLDALLGYAFWRLNVVAEVLLSLPDATPFVETVQRYLDLATVGFSVSDRRRLMSQVRLAPQSKLLLLKAARERLDAYDWEYHHWQNLEVYAFGEGALEWVRDALSADPQGTFAELESWIGDRSPLSDSKATVTHLAEGILFFFADIDLERAFEALAGKRAKGLQYLVEARPLIAAKLALRWMGGESEAKASWGFFISQVVLRGSDVSPKDKTDLIEAIYQRISRRGASAADYHQMRSLLLHADPASRHFNAELFAELADPPAELFDWGSGLSHLLGTEFSATMEALARLKKFNDEQMNALGRFVGQASEHEQIARLLRRILESNLARDWPIGFAIEMQLNLAPAPSAGTSEAVKLARTVLLGSNSAMARTVFYSVLANLREPSAHWSVDLMQGVIEEGLNQETASMVVDRLVSIEEWWPLLGSRLHVIRDCLGEERFAISLIHAAEANEAIARQTTEWIDAYPSILEHVVFRLFKQHITSGRAPIDAARRAARGDGADEMMIGGPAADRSVSE